jgi:hypothetical protein
MTKNHFEKKFIKIPLKYTVDDLLSGFFFSKKKNVCCVIFSFIN